MTLFGITFTLKESIILIVTFFVAISLITSLIQNSTRLLIKIMAFIIVFSVFTWVPEKMIDVFGEDIGGALANTTERAGEYIEKNKDSWIESWHSMWYKIFNGNIEVEEEPETQEIPQTEIVEEIKSEQ